MPEKQVALGFAYALLSLAFFSAYGIPRRYVNSGSMEYMLSLCGGAAIATTAAGRLLGGGVVFDARVIGLSYLSGFTWFLATLCFVYSTDCVGLGKAAVIRNSTVAFGVVVGIVLFREYSLDEPLRLVLVMLGTGLILRAVSVFGRIGASSAVVRPSCPINLIRPKGLVGDDTRASLLGMLFGLSAAVLYALYNVPGRYVLRVTPSIWHFFFYIGQGALAACMLAYAILVRPRLWARVTPREHLLAVLAGFLWAGAFGSLQLSMSRIGLATAWSLANLSTIVQLVISILVFKEIDISGRGKLIASGALAAAAGVLLLGLSRI